MKPGETTYDALGDALTTGSPLTTTPLLTRADRESPVWLKLKGHLEQERDRLRAANDAELDAVQTAKLRGRIAHVKECLALGDEPLQP